MSTTVNNGGELDSLPKIAHSHAVLKRYVRISPLSFPFRLYAVEIPKLFDYAIVIGTT